MKVQLLFLCICFCVSTQAQTTFKKGIIHDSIPVSGTIDETFALYLPIKYKEGEFNSIVFIFEPAARAAIGIQPFINASEEYGHILVCSNNSRNGPYDRNFEITNNLFSHIYANFSIQEDEMYLSGFSGGSRLASAIATVTELFAGVIACGGGFAGVPSYTPTAQDYAYVGLCGDRDMNYKEMSNNKVYLDSQKFRSTLITFDGDHSWPPSEQISRAFNWLHLQKIQKSNSVDSEKILTLYQSDYNRIEQFKTNGELLYASEQYERILNSYSGFLSVDSLVKQNKELLNSKQYNKQLKSHNKILKMETWLTSKFINQITTDLKNPSKSNFGWWEREFKKLNKNKDVEMQKMVYRIKFDLFARVYSMKKDLHDNSNEEQAAFIKRFLKFINPK